MSTHMTTFPFFTRMSPAVVCTMYIQVCGYFSVSLSHCKVHEGRHCGCPAHYCDPSTSWTIWHFVGTQSYLMTECLLGGLCPPQLFPKALWLSDSCRTAPCILCSSCVPPIWTPWKEEQRNLTFAACAVNSTLHPILRVFEASVIPV